MSLIRLKLDGSNIVSESATKEPGYKMAKVSGKTELVIPSSKRAAITEVAGRIKSAIAFGKGYVKYKTLTDKAVAKAKNPKAKSFQKDDARQDAKEARALAANNRKNAKLDLKAANAAARKHGLGGLSFSVNTETVFEPKVLKTAKSTEFGVAGKRGVFKPKFVPDEKFMLIGLTKAAMKANADAAKKKPSHAEAVKRGKTRAKESTLKDHIESALVGDPSKEPTKVGNVALDSYSTKRIPGTKVQISVHDRFAPSKDIQNVVKNLLGKGAVTKGKFVVSTNKLEYKLGTASYRMSKDAKSGKWNCYANFGGNGGGSSPNMTLKAARSQVENSIKRLQKVAKVDRMAAQTAWR